MDKEEPGYYKAECGCVLQKVGDLWKWVYDCKGGWEVIPPTMHKEFPFGGNKTLITKAEVAILKLIGKK